MPSAGIYDILKRRWFHAAWIRRLGNYAQDINIGIGYAPIRDNL